MQSSFPALVENIIISNKNIIELLTQISDLTRTDDNSININTYDTNGLIKTFSMPSFNSIMGEINRLNNNINSIYNIDTTGAIIETTNKNKFKKIVAVNLNREPNSIGSIGFIDKFKATNNWFFEGLMNPMISIELDLTDKIDNNIKNILSRRYIVNFERDVDGNLTNLGQSALNSFNSNFKGSSNILITDFENWHRTTPGVLNPNSLIFDEQMFDLEPNELLYDGVFNVLRIDEDRLNNKLWYVLNDLSYIVRSNNSVEQLSIGSEVIVNSDYITCTRYKVIEVSTSGISPRVRLERIEGIEPISTGLGKLKVYSPILYNRKVRISIGYNERMVIFIKPMDYDNYILAKDWSLGTGFWSNDLKLSSNTSDNGLTMEQFYIDYVYDYGVVLKDLVAKKIPNSLASIPNAPTMNIDNFKVVQINKHLTDSKDSKELKQMHNNQISLKSELTQIQNAIIEKNTKFKFSKFKTESDKKQLQLEIDELVRKKESNSKLLSTITQDIISRSTTNKSIEPKFRVRGFWTIPSAIVSEGTRSQEIVQFKIRYRYLSKDGSEPLIETYEIDSNGKGSYSNWIDIKTDSRKRMYNSATDEYYWEIEDTSDSDTPNINQLDLSIQPNESIEIMVKSISEAGWPESPVESDWSNSIIISFPDDLNSILSDSDFILKEASSEDIKIKLLQELSSRGLDEHLSDTVITNGVVYHHSTDKILSGFKDANGVSLNLYEYIRQLEDRIKGLEEKIKRAKGELQVIVYRNNEEYVISNGGELTFNVECEDYLDKYIANGVPTGRVYANGIYVIKDFVIKIKNKAVNSTLGLLSNRTYLQNPNVYNTGAPQTLWVNDQDELLTSDISGQTRTQLDNQFIWMVNYDSIMNTTVNKLSENIGNQFISNSSNSLTNILSSSEYNIGYNESSILSFIGNNKSLLDTSKWVDVNSSVSSTTKLLTSIHPVVPSLENLVESNIDKVRSIDTGDNNDITIPLNIYFKMNSLDNNQNTVNYKYINLNSIKNTVTHIKKVKFFLENESENRPFIFTVKFNINRSKVIFKKAVQSINSNIK